MRNRSAIYSFLSRVYEKQVTMNFLEEYSSKNSPLLRMGEIEDLGNMKLKEGFQEITKYFTELKRRRLGKGEARAGC